MSMQPHSTQTHIAVCFTSSFPSITASHYITSEHLCTATPSFYSPVRQISMYLLIGKMLTNSMVAVTTCSPCLTPLTQHFSSNILHYLLYLHPLHPSRAQPLPQLEWCDNSAPADLLLLWIALNKLYVLGC